ncbi:carbohydrate ABC transporter permease [Micromonospora aurantiaca (nom. illeg.)]|uniref:carbohydrate ABC transporter permease n=1 Tax=Micromonospora aurantiaca (nom. illeg.) TaxID=47850 RepID=UPI001656ED0C|nr:sugar ABC transporter permease [Micromonospora aurantiaca]MBC9005396.1 sugar ABC transporter permease [Micromonospora aurantiaca]
MEVTAPPDPRRATARRRVRSGRRQALLGWLFAAPTAAFVAALFAVPLLLVLKMAASRWPLLAGDQGLNAPDNVTRAVSHRFFSDSFVFTVKYTLLATVLLIALGLGLALLVQESSRWNNLLRASFLVPGALGLASASLLFYVIYSPYASPFAPVMRRLDVTFLGSPNAALLSTVFLVVWRYAGFYMVLMLVGLQSIPADVFEAARADGASRWQTFRRVTLPLLRPTLALTTVLCVTGSLLAFEQFYILTKGGPDNSTVTVVQLIYMIAFQGQNDLGVAAALSVVVLVALVLLNALQLRAFRPEER